MSKRQVNINYKLPLFKFSIQETLDYRNGWKIEDQFSIVTNYRPKSRLRRIRM